MLAILLSKWKEILLVIAVLSATALVYNKIYTRGFENANTKWEERVEQMEAKLDGRISSIEQLSKTTIEQTLIANYKVAEDMKKLRDSIKNIPLTTIPNCKPSLEFGNIYNQAIKRGNAK